MSLNILVQEMETPQDVEDIIFSYKNQLEHTSKFKKTLDIIKNIHTYYYIMHNEFARIIVNGDDVVNIKIINPIILEDNGLKQKYNQKLSSSFGPNKYYDALYFDKNMIYSGIDSTFDLCITD